MSTRFTPALLCLLVLPAMLRGAPAQTADEVVEKHIVALGGRAALAKLTSRKSTGTVTISTPAGNLSGPIEISLKAPNKSRAYMQLDLSAIGGADKMVLDQKFDGAAGWTLNSLQGDTQITGNQLDNMRNNAFPTALSTYKDKGAKLEVLPKEQVAGKDAIVLLVTPKTGPVIKILFDAQTYLVVRTVTKISSPEAGELEQTSDPTDYRTVDGVKVPFVVTNTNALQTITIKLDKVEHNVPIDDAIFSAKTP
jgi:outer membrane lipoprotein-sorting protein